MFGKGLYIVFALLLGLSLGGLPLGAEQTIPISQAQLQQLSELLEAQESLLIQSEQHLSSLQRKNERLTTQLQSLQQHLQERRGLLSTLTTESETLSQSIETLSASYENYKSAAEQEITRHRRRATVGWVAAGVLGAAALSAGIYIGIVYGR